MRIYRSKPLCAHCWDFGGGGTDSFGNTSESQAAERSAPGGSTAGAARAAAEAAANQSDWSNTASWGGYGSKAALDAAMKNAPEIGSRNDDFSRESIWSNPNDIPTLDQINAQYAGGIPSTDFVSGKYTTTAIAAEKARASFAASMAGLGIYANADERAYGEKNKALAEKAIADGKPGYLSKFQSVVRDGIKGIFSTPDYANQAAAPSYEFSTAKQNKKAVEGWLDVASVVTFGAAFLAKSPVMAAVSNVVSKVKTGVSITPVEAFSSIEPDVEPTEKEIAEATKRDFPDYGPSASRVVVK